MHAPGAVRIDHGLVQLAATLDDGGVDPLPFLFAVWALARGARGMRHAACSNHSPSRHTTTRVSAPVLCSGAPLAAAVGFSDGRGRYQAGRREEWHGVNLNRACRGDRRSRARVSNTYNRRDFQNTVYKVASSHSSFLRRLTLVVDNYSVGWHLETNSFHQHVRLIYEISIHTF